MAGRSDSTGQSLRRPDAADLVDAVDSDDRPIGVLSRGEVLDRHAGFRTVHVIVVDATGQLVLQRLAERRERHPGRIGSSAAGYLFRGESYGDAARRVLELELDVTEPPHFVTKLRMDDAGSTKFVAVFGVEADDAVNASPEQIGSLVRLRPPAIDAALADAPSTFTPTFGLAYRAWRARPA